MGQNYPQFTGPWYSISDIEIGRISANEAYIELIFHTDRNGAFYGRFEQGPKEENGDRSPIWARINAGLYAR